MAKTLVVLFLLIPLASCQEQPTPSCTEFPLGDVRNCPVKSPQDGSQPLYQMEVLPGIGFDNLRNLDMGQVHAYNFSTCQVSKDGKYLLPDSVFLIPVQESKVDAYAEYFDHWDNYTSMTSYSMNLDASFFSHIGGKLSADYTATKSHMHGDKAKSTRVQIRHKLYTVKLQPDAQLHPSFKNRIYDIAGHIQNNNTEYANYLAELVVRDYGTHYLSSMDAGAILSQQDFVQISEDLKKSQNIKNVKASASVNFFSKVSLGATFKYSSSDSAATDFINSRTHSQVVTVGGPPFTPNLTLDEWERGVANALVATDRSGDPLHYAITPTSLPMLPENTVRAVADCLRLAINRYYKVNTRLGCTNPNAVNFDFHANVDDAICKVPSTNFSFGGIFQKCTPDLDHQTEDLCTGGPEPALQVNPLTGDFSCPPNYTQVLLHSGTVSHITHKTVCNNVCHRCHLIKHCCHCDNILTPFFSLAHYKAYWCASLNGVQLQQSEGYLFGGYYTSKVTNPVTGIMSCPRFFYPLHMGEDIKVCVSTDYERGYAYAIDFAGFDSCTVGNPLTVSMPSTHQAQWPHICPHGYAQHLVTVDDGCEINFCVRAGVFKPNTVYSPKLPPFRKHPKYKYNITDTLVMFGVYGKIWVKNNEGVWDEVKSETENGQALLAQLDLGSSPAASSSSYYDKNNTLPSGAVAVLSILSTLVLGVIVIAIAFFGRRAFKKRKRAKVQYRENYVRINESGDTNSTGNPTSDSA